MDGGRTRWHTTAHGAPLVPEGVAVTGGVGANTASEKTKWDFGPDATPSTATGPSATVMFATDGVKYPTLTATNAAGCTATFTENYSGDSAEIVSCSPHVPADTTVVTNTGGSGGTSTLVCGGGSASAGGGLRHIYVAAGGTFNFTGGGMYFFYVAAGGTLNVGGGGQAYVLREPNATVNYGSSNAIKIDCPAVTFDTSALLSACP